MYQVNRQPIKIVFLGPAGCGKSSIISKLCFDSTHVKQTIGCDQVLKNMIINNKQYQLSLWDIAGSELDSHLMKVYMRDAFGVFLVSDIQSEETQIQLNKYKENVLVYCEKFDDGPIPMIVLQNKLDLIDRNKVLDDFMMIDNLHSFCQQKKYITGYQTSAITLSGVRDAFEQMVSIIEERQLLQKLAQDKKINIKQNQSQYRSQTNIFDRQRNDECF